MEIIDARPLSVHDPHWSVSLPLSEAEQIEEREQEGKEGDADRDGREVLDREKELLAKVDQQRKYQDFFFVDRT